MFRASIFAVSSTLLAAAGCGGGAGDGESCTGDETRCDGSDFQVCSGGSFRTTESCAGTTVCDPSIGCAECTPAGGTFCSGDDVLACSGDGAIGDVVDTCEPGMCSGGSCGSGLGCASGADLIYLVADNNDFFSFDPEKLGTGADPFDKIGTLSCPAGSAYGGGQARPFSMSVDREARAWVLYSSGEIFHVSTETGACEASGYSKGQAGFELFGMGFVTDGADTEAETLFVSGGDAGDTTPGDLGAVEKSSMMLTKVGALPDAQLGPELTGTGAGKLYGYFPGTSSFVAELDKGTGSDLQRFPLDGVGGGFSSVAAWAFAHYGGKFYIFVSVAGAFGDVTSDVIELDPAGPDETKVLSDTGRTIVGAGVSTCAPIVVD
jgi:hypothetical protein